MMMTKSLKLLLAVAAAASINVAMAHGPEAPKFGGTVASAGDLGFELAASGDVVHLYVEDHGKPRSTTGMTGKLTVLNGADKVEADLTPVADGSKLEAKGVKLQPGAKAVAAVALPNKKVITVRF